MLKSEQIFKIAYEGTGHGEVEFHIPRTVKLNRVSPRAPAAGCMLGKFLLFATLGNKMDVGFLIWQHFSDLSCIIFHLASCVYNVPVLKGLSIHWSF